MTGVVAKMWMVGWVLGAEPIDFSSPGFPPSRMDAEGRLVEDWGVVAVQLGGEGLSAAAVKVEAVQWDSCILAAQATGDRRNVQMI